MAAVAKQPTIAGGALSVDALPSSTLTPNFFDSIFNDGMNPFDEFFAGSPAPGNLASLSASTRKEYLHSDKPRLIKDETLPAINTKLDQTLTPEQSPKSLNATDSSLLSNLRLSRSPSPFAFDSIATTFPDSPVSSITPITSPEELTPITVMAREQFTISTPVEPVAAGGNLNAQISDNSQANMPSPQSWSSNAVGLPLADQKTDSVRARRQTLPQGVECLAKPATRSRQRLLSDAPVVTPFSRMDGIFVTENIPSAEVKVEPISPTTPNFQSLNSTTGRKRKRSSVEFEDDNDADLDGKLNESEKRARFLERNRIAASKCRKKKKIMNQRLEEKSRILVQQNRFLNATLVKLRSDVLRLKQMVLTHHGCGNPAIEQYLQQESEKYLVADSEEAAKKKEDARLAGSLAKPAGINGIVKTDESFHPNVGGSSSAWLNEFHSFEEVESEVLKQSHLLDFNDDDFQKLLLGDQLTALHDDFATPPPAYD
ncbi:uncharacterized protein DFL_008605 [Arthrobotrys flagrans]|uniref:BZIP domain-containing protein n=1 Tax=Arthrobotrys flagrans TaxID=97331 RepID=A0A436ZP85_ARTFL|nr:hypothetical protein DFL_008605 [Arthrobotrys flagrans]